MDSSPRKHQMPNKLKIGTKTGETMVVALFGGYALKIVLEEGLTVGMLWILVLFVALFTCLYLLYAWYERQEGEAFH